MDQPTVATLQAIDEFRELPTEALQWLLDHSKVIQLRRGEHLFKPGQTIHHLYVQLEGRIELKIQQGNQLIEAGRWEAGTISGMLPYSRMEAATGFGLAVADTYLLALPEELFPEMEQVSRDMVKVFVGVMTNRTRSFIRLQQRNEKMMALGKLSAGLAHELNNPAAAIVRSSRALKEHLSTTPENFKQVITMQLSAEQVDEVNAIIFSRINQTDREKPTMMERSAREDEMADWLEDQGVSDGYDIAENFAEFSLQIDELEQIGDILKGQHLVPVFQWLNNVLITERMVGEIQEASGRISELVASVKSYTHMDRSPDRVAANIHEGIDSTLTLLNHKVKEKNIRVVKHYEENLPTIPLFVSEMNQVWTNLIDNAIDAMEKDGTLTITTRTEQNDLRVDVEDTGSGIPPDIQSSVFDPFFTTKGVGQGTGLGLDIARKIVEQHDGTITLESEPGHTQFTMCFPLAT